MSRVLIVSKPIAPPFSDGTRNLIRDLAAALEPGELELLTPRAPLPPPLTTITRRPIYRGRGIHAVGGGDAARLLAHLTLAPLPPILHWFFTPSPVSARLPSLMARFRGRRTVWTLPSAPRMALTAEHLVGIDRLIVLSEQTRDRMIRGGAHPDVVQVMRPWLAPQSPPAESEVEATRIAFGLRERTTVFCGDLGPGRGHDLSLEAFARIATERDVLVIAARPKGEHARACRAALVERTRELGIGARVRMVDTVPNMAALLAAADVVLLPATNLEAKVDVPLVLLEALALERAVLVAEGAPPADLAARGAAIAAPAEAPVLASALRSLLDSRDARIAIGKRGREVLLRDHAASVAADAHRALYRSLR
jgi:phosphatidylinositol alpha-1,6-mannosyltransferase